MSNDEKILLEILRDIPPFDRFVSRGDTPDDVDIPGPHADADASISLGVKMVKASGGAAMVPILGKAGLGKTHFYWVVKKMGDKNHSWRTIYVPTPPSPARALLHIYTCIMDDAGTEIIDEVSALLVSKYHIPKLLGGYNVKKMIERALGDHPGLAGDVVKALILYGTGKMKELAKRWLLGETLSQEELVRLGVREIIDVDDMALAAIRIITKYVSVPLVLFIDELEALYNTGGAEAERAFLESLKKIFNEGHNIVFVLSCLEDIWPRIKENLDETMKSRMNPEVSLKPFKKEDLIELVRKKMEIYWSKNNMMPPDNDLFPFNTRILGEIYRESGGNPRDAIKLLLVKMESILYGIERKMKKAKKSDESVIKPTPAVIIDALYAAMKAAAEKNGWSVILDMATGEQKNDNKTAAAIMKLSKDGREIRICVDIPYTKQWARGGGVASFYAAKRIKNMLDTNLADIGLMFIPSGKTGAKFNSLREELGNKLVVKSLTKRALTQFLTKVKDGTIDETVESIGKEILSEIERCLA